MNSISKTALMAESQPNARGVLVIGIPSGRDISHTLALLRLLCPDSPSMRIPVVIGRWDQEPIDAQIFAPIQESFQIQIVYSAQKYPPALRNSIINHVCGGSILFLDDDVVPARGIIDAAKQLIAADPACVYQGVPYLNAYIHNWYASMESQVYKQGFLTYVHGDRVTLLDARVMLAPHAILAQTPFDDRLIFGGEGRDLADRLMRQGVSLKLAPTLITHHYNRNSLSAVVSQKIIHGRGRGQHLALYGPGSRTWRQYIQYYLFRHFVKVIKDVLGHRMSYEEASYHILTNTVFWYGAIIQYLLRRTER